MDNPGGGEQLDGDRRNAPLANTTPLADSSTIARTSVRNASWASRSVRASWSSGVRRFSSTATLVGVMVEDKARGGLFTSVTLKPTVTIASGSNSARARAVHEDAHAKCFVANSVNFPVTCEPTIVGG